MFIVSIAVGWLLLVSLSVIDVLLKLVIIAVAKGWQLWLSLMVDGWLLVVLWLEFRLVDVGWQ